MNESGNIPRCGVVPRFSDLEIIALSLTSEAIGIDSESFLFSKLQEYRTEIPNLVSRRQYNDRRKYTSSLCKVIRERIVQRLDGCEEYNNCTVIGDKGYISAEVQLDLFETVNISFEVPYRSNQKDWKPTFAPFAKFRKRIETLFSQLCDQFMIVRNYAKDTEGLFTRIIGKISAMTILQYINKLNGRPIGRIKYALM